MTQRATMTIGELLEVYLREHVAFLKNHRGTSRRLQQYISPFAALPLADLTRLQVIEWHREIAQSRGPNAARHALEDLHSLYVKAVDWGLFVGANPADRVKKFPKKSRSRFVRTREMPWLMAALDEEMPRDQTFFLLLLMTGARRDEARLAKWADLDLEEGLWHKSRTKGDKRHTIPLPTVMIERLRVLPRPSEWVFTSCPNGKNNFAVGLCWSGTAVEKSWRRIRARAGLKDLKIHDLRRTCASWLACHGSNLSVIQQVLNHSSLAVTNIYARLHIDPVRRALEEQSRLMLGLRPPVAAAPTPPGPAAIPSPVDERAEPQEWPVNSQQSNAIN